jgi:NAD(P)-dependent dehydrogenase (short-subunit alcohol dehydrogenase family)
MRAVVLTGVSRGLGAALFDILAARGDRLLALGRGFTEAQAALAAAEPQRVRLHRADLGDAGQVPTAAQLRPALAGAAEVVLLHNAAVVEPVGAVGDLDPAALAAATAVNLTAPMLLTNAFLAARPAGAATRVLFVSSSAAHRVVGGWAAYCATKAGGEAFFEVLAAQLAGEPDTRVASVNPGRMDTAMQGTLRAAARAGAYFPQADDFVAAHAQGRLPDPATVARRIVDDHL